MVVENTGSSVQFGVTAVAGAKVPGVLPIIVFVLPVQISTQQKDNSLILLGKWF